MWQPGLGRRPMGQCLAALAHLTAASEGGPARHTRRAESSRYGETRTIASAAMAWTHTRASPCGAEVRSRALSLRPGAGRKSVRICRPERACPRASVRRRSELRGCSTGATTAWSAGAGTNTGTAETRGHTPVFSSGRLTTAAILPDRTAHIPVLLLVKTRLPDGSFVAMERYDSIKRPATPPSPRHIMTPFQFRTPRGCPGAPPSALSANGLLR